MESLTLPSGHNHVPVVICGGGPVGLSTAIELARHGVRSVVLEKHPTTAIHPKARNVNSRTMEIFRQWGPEALHRLRRLNLPRGWTDQIVYARTLAGEEYGRVPTPGFAGLGGDITTERPILTSQDRLEPVLVDIARATGLVDIRFGHEVFDVSESDLGVVVAATDQASGTTHSIQATYVVAADGARSPMRRRLGIKLVGRTNLSHSINVHFDADLSSLVDDRRAVMYWLADEDHRGVFQPLDGMSRWLCQISYDGTDHGRARYDRDGCVGWIRDRAGDTTIEPIILSMIPWSTNACVAASFRHGRVFLVGDAAHQMPPTGGFGMNTGVQSGHNLAWKLAHVLDGRAAPSLLDTFHDERHPVATNNVQRSLDNSRYVGDVIRAVRKADPVNRSPAQAVRDAHRYGNFAGMELGYHYDSAAVVPDGTAAPQPDDPVSTYVPTARPGHRLPHLRGPSPDSSIHDLIGTGLTLLSAGQSPDGTPAPVTTVDVARQGFDPATFHDLYELEAGGAVLVRPDGHVAARWSNPPNSTDIWRATAAIYDGDDTDGAVA